MILIALALFAHGDQVYTWTDENGVRHFSQESPPDGIRRDSIRTDVQNSAIRAGDGTLPVVAETARCTQPVMDELRQRRDALAGQLRQRMHQCQVMARDDALLVSLADCQRQARRWHQDSKDNVERALAACHGTLIKP